MNLIKQLAKLQQQGKSSGINSIDEEIEPQTMNLDHKHWVKKFIYPFGLDPAPPKFSDIPSAAAGASVGHLVSGNKDSQGASKDKLDLISTKRFEYPLSHMEQKEEFLRDICRPIRMEHDDIIKDMFKLARDFPVNVIPHITEQGDVVDILHNYDRSDLEKLIEEQNEENAT